MSTLSQTLDQLRTILSVEVWERRVAAAKAEALRFDEVVRLISDGSSRPGALVAVWPERPVDTGVERLERYLEGGVDALIDLRRPNRAECVTPEVGAMVRGMLAANRELRSPAITAALRSAGVSIGGSTVRAFLAQEGLAHGVGRPSKGRSKAHPLPLAGTELLLGIEAQTGAVAALTRAMGVALDALEAPRGPALDDSAHRDDRGRFQADYNRPEERTDPELGDRFDSVEERRSEKDLPAMRVATASEKARYRKDLALTFLPILVEGARWSELRHWRGAHLEDLVGIAYQPSTLDKHARELKLAGLASTVREATAKHWLLPGDEAVDSVTGFVLAYCDVTTKPIWTHHFSKCAKVSTTGRVQPASSTFFLNSGSGTPLLYRTFSGHCSVPKEVGPMLQEYERIAGENTVRRLVVLDRESHAVWLFKELNATKWHWVIPLRKQVVGKNAQFSGQSPWEAYGTAGDEVCEAQLLLNDSRPGHGALQVRVVGRKRHRTGTVSWYATNGPPDLLGAADVLRIYFDRWPLQEHVFRNAKGRVGLDRQHGYGKKRVNDVAIVDKLDESQARMRRLEGALSQANQDASAARLLIEQQRSTLARAEPILAQKTLRLDQAVAMGQHGSAAFGQDYKAAEAIRKWMIAATEAIAAAEITLGRAEKTQMAARRSIERLTEEITHLESRRRIFTVDTELDEIMCGYKITFMNMCQHLIRHHLKQPMELDTLIQGVLSLPGERVRSSTTETIRIYYQPRDPTMMEAVRRACASMSALGLVRDGRKLRYEVVDSSSADGTGS